MTFGEWIKQERLSRNLNQAAFAEKVGLEYPALVSQWETGRLNTISKERMKALTSFLGKLPEGVKVRISDPRYNKPNRFTKRQRAQNELDQVKTEVVEHSISIPSWFDLGSSVIVAAIKERLGLDTIEQMILAGCFGINKRNTTAFSTVEFSDKVCGVHLPYYMEKLGLRFATFTELLMFGAVSELWHEKPIVQFGTRFKDGFSSNDDRVSDHSHYANGGEVVGAVLGNFPDSGKTLTFWGYQPLLICRFDSWTAQQPKVVPGNLVLTVKKSAKESVFPSGEEMKTIAVMRRAGLDQAFNDHLFEKAKKAATDMGKDIKDTPTVRKLLFDAYYSGSEYELYVALGIFPDVTTKAG